MIRRREPAAPLGPAAQESDRAISPISGRSGLGRRGQVIGVTALAALGGLFFLATGRHPQAAAAARLEPVRQVVAFEPAAPTLANPGAHPPSLGSETPQPVSPTAPKVPALQPPEPPGAATSTADSEPLMAYSRSAAPIVEPIAITAHPVSAADRDPVAMAHAHRLGGRNFAIFAGATIPCVLLSAIDSSTPGPVSCLIPTDVYSESATVVLLEKGTRVVGDYVGLKSGERRLVVRWTRAVTPTGVAITLASPGADPLGRTGLDGSLDDHPMRQFGGAVLMSVVEGAMSALGRSASTVSLSLPSRVADTALRSGLQVTPTLRKPAGSEIAILVAQDLDFSDVYEVRAAP